MKDRVKAILGAIGITALLDTSCGIALSEDVVLYTDESAHAHELRHTEQMRLVGGSDIFWEAWQSDPKFRCASEMDAGSLPEDHFGCYNVDTTDWTSDTVQEIIYSRRK